MDRSTRVVRQLAAIAAVIAIIVPAGLWLWRQNSYARSFGPQYRRTGQIISCIEQANGNYLTINGRWPATIEECLSAAVSERYRFDASCSAPGPHGLRDYILGGLDAWGQPLRYESRGLGDGMNVQVTVISLGGNGVRDFDGGFTKGDDIVGRFYLHKPIVRPEKSIRGDEGDK